MKVNRIALKIGIAVMGLLMAAVIVWLCILLFCTEALVPVETVMVAETAPAPEAEPVTVAQTREEPEPELEPEPVHLVFAGDVQLSSYVMSAYEKAGGITGVVDGTLLDQIRSADIFMVNEEFPFSDRGSAADKQYTFRSPPSDVAMFQEMGIDIVTLANNHALDYGREALSDSCDTLDRAGILYVGAGENLDRAKKLETIEAEGKTMGFLGASRVIPVGSWNAGADTPGMLTTYDPAILVEEIKKAREQCDFLVVYVHWGIERKEKPEAYQRELGEKYIDAGADLVIGSHPHVLQGIEYYKGKPIVYSLGNFVFGSSIPKTMLLKAVLDGDQLSLSIVPGTSSGGFTKAVAGEEKLKAFYQYMEEISFGITIDKSGRIIPPDSGNDTEPGTD